MPLIGRFAIPSRRLGWIPDDSISPLQHQSEMVLGVRVVLLSGFLEPASGSRQVFGNPLPMNAQDGQIILRFGVTLLRGFTIPYGSLLKIRRDAVAFRIKPPQMILRHRQPLVGSFAVPFQRLPGFFSDPFAARVHLAHRKLGEGVPFRRQGEK